MSDFLTGRVLIASPWIGDPRFEQSLILLCKHSDEGALGIVVNKPLEGVTLPEILEQLDIRPVGGLSDRRVLNGGPINRDRGFVLHSDDYYLEESTHQVVPGINLTATREVLSAIAREGAPRQSALALGYASWFGGQLESELEQNAWLIGAADSGLVFGPEHEQKWLRALDRIGVDPMRYSSEAGHC